MLAAAGWCLLRPAALAADHTSSGDSANSRNLEIVEQKILKPERQAAAVLESAMLAAPEFTLYSIAPDSFWVVHPPGTPLLKMVEDKRGRGWVITGTAVLRNKADMAALASSLRTDIDHNVWASALCFRPREALRFQRGKDVVTILICFECVGCEISGFRERKKEGGFHLASMFDELNGQTARIWNEIYRRAGLTLEVVPPRPPPPRPPERKNFGIESLVQPFFSLARPAAVGDK